MRIMGIDPGTARVGWAVVDINGSRSDAKAYGCITTQKTTEQHDRLSAIYRSLRTLLRTYKPESVAVEELFFATNAKTAMRVGEARGVILLAAAQYGGPVVSYSPLAIKQTICGSGQADKSQVQKMIMRLLHLSRIPQPDDAADALAIALTHAYSYKFTSRVS